MYIYIYIHINIYREINGYFRNSCTWANHVPSSCAQGNHLPQGYCGDNRVGGRAHCFHDCIYNVLYEKEVLKANLFIKNISISLQKLFQYNNNLTKH